MALEHNKTPHAVPAGKGHVCIIPMSDWGERLIKEDDETISEKVIAAAESIIPGLSSDIEFVAVKKWYPVAVMFKPGEYKDLGRFMEQRKKHKRVKLAGDYFSGGSMNTSVTAGERAAREIVEEFC